MNTPKVKYLQIDQNDVLPGDVVTLGHAWGASTGIAEGVEERRDVKAGKKFSVNGKLFPAEGVEFLAGIRVVQLATPPTEPGLYRVMFNPGAPVMMICRKIAEHASPDWAFVAENGHIDNVWYPVDNMQDALSFDLLYLFRVQDKVDA